MHVFLETERLVLRRFSMAVAETMAVHTLDKATWQQDQADTTTPPA
jgi:hypothetical protein